MSIEVRAFILVQTLCIDVGLGWRVAASSYRHIQAAICNYMVYLSPPEQAFGGWLVWRIDVHVPVNEA